MNTQQLLKVFLRFALCFLLFLPSARAAWLTFVFDDTFDSNYVGTQILHEYGHKGVLAINTYNIGRGEKDVNWTMLKNAQEQGSEIASHSVVHEGLNMIPLTFADEGLGSWWPSAGHPRVFETFYLYPKLSMVLQDGMLLMKRGTLDEVERNPGSYLFKDGKIYVSSTDGTHPGLLDMRAGSAERELVQSQLELSQHGLEVKTFIPPYNAWNQSLANLAQPHYVAVATGKIDGGLGAALVGYNSLPPRDVLNLARMPIRYWMTVQDVKNMVNQAEANNSWLILLIHGVGEPGVDSGWPLGMWSAASLRELSDWLRTQPITVLTLNEGASRLRP